MANLIAVIFYFICLNACSVICAKFPSDITKCAAGNPECMQKISNAILRNSQKGHQGLNLIPLDPLSISGIKLKQGSDSPVNIELDFKNVQLHGLSECTIYSVSGYNVDPNGKYEFGLKCPVLKLIGPYVISGQVLILPITGDGKSNMTLINPDVKVTFNGKTKTQNGKEYLDVQNLKLTFSISRLIMQFDNLYRGDKALGDGTNLFLNENWEIIFNELKQNIFDAFSLIVENVFNNVHSKFPYKDMFL